MKFSFYLITLFSFLKIINSSTRKIDEINSTSFHTYINENKDNEIKKFLVIFYIKNNTFCKQALNTIENEVIKDYNDESGILFGKIDINSEYLLSYHFNATKIPYIILIQGEYFYELRQKPDKYSIKDLIDLPMDNSEKKKIPEINFNKKLFDIIVMTINNISEGFYSLFKIRLNKNIIIFVLILILFGFLWLIQKILCFICCCRLCCKCKRKKKKENVINFNNNEISKEEIEEQSSGVSGSDNGNKENENNNIINKISINDDIFNNQISEEEILSKQKQD